MINKSIQNAVFSAAEIMLPDTEDLQSWSVIACDQFTSQPEYWQQVETVCQGKASALDLIVPEAVLNDASETMINRIHTKMEQFLREHFFITYQNCFIYTERTLMNGEKRCGLVGKLDLEQYDYKENRDTAVRATEMTVAERIPPRMAVRRGARLEMPHILLLCDDEEKMLIEPLGREKEKLKKLYDFELMLGGGHVSGWLVTGEEKRKTEERIHAYENHERQKHPSAALLYAVGDGNHSLATAKACYEELKNNGTGENLREHPARYALCELNNIHDSSQHFEPIHRLIKHCDWKALITDLRRALESSDGIPIHWKSAENVGVLHIRPENGRLPLSTLQSFLDLWLKDNAGEIDYIHGKENLLTLAEEEDSIGFLLPSIEKEGLFPEILSDGVLPRKAFSIGEAQEKRYYLETRRIQ